MFTFFRRFRHSFLESGLFTKYMTYAIGEIVLVVIGILVALQINNWNEDRKLRKQEKLILEQIHASLLYNQDFHDMLLNSRIPLKLNSIDSLLTYLSSSGPKNDSTIVRHIRYADYAVTYNYDAGAYESLKSAGFDVISNDSLRLRIINQFDLQYPRGKMMIDQHDNAYELLLAGHLNQFSSMRLYQSSDDTWRTELKVNSETLLSNKHFTNWIHLQQDIGQNYAYRTRHLHDTTEELVLMIQAELQSLE